MDVVRDVLDNQLVDRDQSKMGRVDGVVIELRDGQPPRLAYIEVGTVVLARRLHPRLGRWAAALGRRWGLNQGQPYRIPWSLTRDIGIDVELDVKAGETPILDWERWLREHVVERIPG